MEHGQRLDSITVYVRVRKSTNLILIFAGKDESRSNVSVTDSTRRGRSERGETGRRETGGRGSAWRGSAPRSGRWRSRRRGSARPSRPWRTSIDTLNFPWNLPRR